VFSSPVSDAKNKAVMSNVYQVAVGSSLKDGMGPEAPRISM
jgi:hypothetical protein